MDWGLRDDHFGSAKHFAFPEVPFLNLARNSGIREFMAEFRVNGFVQGRIKWLANTFERQHAALFQQLMDLSLDGTHTLIDLRLSLQRLRLKGPIKAVLHGHKVQQQVPDEGFGFVDSILGGSLPVVFKLSQRLRAELFLRVKRGSQFLQLVSMRLFQSG